MPKEGSRRQIRPHEPTEELPEEEKKGVSPELRENIDRARRSLSAYARAYPAVTFPALAAYKKQIKRGERTPESLFEEEVRVRKEYEEFSQVATQMLRKGGMPTFDELKFEKEVWPLEADFWSAGLADFVLARLSSFAVGITTLRDAQKEVHKKSVEEGSDGHPKNGVDRAA